MTMPAQITLGNEPKPQEKIYDFNHGKPMNLTHEAIVQVKTFTQANADKIAGKLFRVLVEGGGCSGMQYGFTFDEPKENDHIIECEDIKVLLSKDHEQFVKGAVVDYVSQITGSGFIVKNPVSKGECGCGISFAV